MIEDNQPSLESEPPWQLKVTASLLMWGGISSVCELIAGMMNRNIRLDFGFISILLAFGLLRRSRPSIFWAKWLSLFFAGVMLIVTFITVSKTAILGGNLWEQLPVDGSLDEAGGFGAIIASIVLLSLVIGCAATFLLPPVKRWLDLPELPTNSHGNRSWLWTIALLSTLFASSQLMTESKHDQDLASLYLADTTITLRDHVTGKTISSGQISPKTKRSKKQKAKEYWNISTRVGPSQEGGSNVAFRLGGKVIGKLELEASSEGYEPTPLIVDQTTPKQLDVSLKPLKQSEGDPNPAAP